MKPPLESRYTLTVVTPHLEAGGDTGNNEEGGSLIFVSDASAEAERLTTALRGRGYYAPGCWSPLLDEDDDEALVPIVSTPSHLWVVVAGGDGRHSAWMPAWNVCEGATEAVEPGIA